MKRAAWKKWLAIAGISAVLVGGAGLWAVNHAADFVLESVVNQPMRKALTETGEKTAGSAGQAAGSNNGKDGSDRQEEASPLPSAPPEQGDKQAAPSSQPQPIAEEAKPSSGSGSGKKGNAAYSAEISSDKAEQVQDEVTAQEKSYVMTTVFKKFSLEELNLFMRMASGGLSLEEKKEAKKIFLEKLNEEEYDKLIAIASKYGLSQGKNYQDSLK